MVVSNKTGRCSAVTNFLPLDIDGPAAPPRSNGELLFTEPWESRAFGVAIALHDAAVFPWSAFQAALIARIAAWEAAPSGEWSYYRHWLAALEDVLVDNGTVDAGAVEALSELLAERPAGHDHPHPH